MERPDRRQVLSWMASLTALPAVAEAASDPTARLVQEQRRVWEVRQRTLIMGVIPDGRFRVDDPAVVALRELSRGFTAFNTLHAFRRLPPEEQAHPGVQAIFLDIARSLGEAVLLCRDLLEAFVEGDGPSDYVQLHGALRVLRLSSASWGLTPARASMLKEAFDLTEAPHKPLSRRRLEKQIQRIDRLEALIDRAGDDFPELLERAPAHVQAAAARGAAQHGTTPTHSEDIGLAAQIGFILLGITFLNFGVFIAMVGICELGCGNPAGALLILLGLALIGLAFWSFTRAGLRLNRSRRLALPDAPAEEEALLDDVGALLPDEPCVNIFVGDDWVVAPMRRSPDGPIRLVARGRVHGPWGWLASANGDGVAAGPGAPLPGAPEVSLLARVDGEVIFVGAEGEIPAGEGGFALRLNVEPQQDGEASGYFHVCRQ